MNKAASDKATRMDELFSSIGSPKFINIPTCVGTNCPAQVFSNRLRSNGRANNEGKCSFSGEAIDVLVGSSICPIEPSVKER